MNTRKLLISVLFGFLIFTQAVSQLQQPHRFEKEQKYSDEDFTIIPLKIEGIALVREKNKFKSGKQFWEVILLDTTLHEKNTLELELEVGNELTGYEYSPGYVHLLFIRNETKGEMGLLSIDLTTQDKQFYEIKPELNFMLTQFCRTGDNFAFGGYVNHEPAVLLYSPSNNNIKIVPGFFSKNI